MIIVKFHGRLGNQMFQYAFALCTAHKFRTFFLIDRLRKSNLVDYFQTGYTFSSKEFNDKMVRFCRKAIRRKVYQESNETVQSLNSSIRNNCYYQGYFQSEAYFNGISSLVKKHFIIRKRYRDAFESKFGFIFQQHEIIAIHCRLGDYIEWGSDELGGKDLTLPKNYYKKALFEIENFEKYKIIIVTDDPKNIANRFDFIPDKLIVSEAEIIDFQILQNADQVIISNSSFSWWAAYLNTKSAPVYAPKYWLGFKIKEEYPDFVIPSRWNKITT
jgi:hypothetical protein